PAGQAGPAFLVLARCAQAHRLLGQKKNGCLATAIFCIGWCPGEDSVTQARPRPGRQARPFSSSRDARRRIASWAKRKMAVLRQPFFVSGGAQERTRTSTPCGTWT